jgi:uncharacterized membrane protein YraQ (UPF0718 family)
LRSAQTGRPASFHRSKPSMPRCSRSGTVLAFTMSVVVLSAPELVLPRRVLEPRLVAVLVAVAGAGILAVGFLLDAVL